MNRPKILKTVVHVLAMKNKKNTKYKLKQFDVATNFRCGQNDKLMFCFMGPYPL